MTPRVTTILGRSGLVNKEYYQPSYARRGRLVHEACCLWDDNELYSCDPAIEPYVDAYIAFREQFTEPWILRERRLHEPTLHYNGQPDRGALVYRQHKPVGILIDLKAGVREKWHPIQLAAYERLYRLWLTTEYEDLPGIHVDGASLTIERWVVYLGADGTFQRIPCLDTQDWAVFLACLTLYRYHRRTNGEAATERASA